MANVTVYVMTVWANLPTKTSALEATNLNHLEQGIKNVTDFVNTLNTNNNTYLYLSQTPFTNVLKSKLDGIEAEANKYILPKATTSALGGVKVDGTTITIDSNGVISGQGGAISLLSDVELSQLADGQILKWDATEEKWVNTSEAEVRTQLSLLEDVDIDDQTLADGDALRYNGTTEKWENGQAGDVLGYDETLEVLGDPGHVVPSIPIIYSTNERVIGKWINGKPLYEKTFDFGALPNSSQKTVAHNLTNLDIIWIHDALAFNSNEGWGHPVNFGTYCIAELSNTSIQISTNGDQTRYNKCYVTLRYTKTTDPIPT